MDDDKIRQSYMPAGQTPKFREYLRDFPTSLYFRRRAPRKVPAFSFAYADTGAGDDVGIAHNWASLDGVKIVPRYGVTNQLPPVDVELFGQRYAAPISSWPRRRRRRAFPTR